MIDLYRIEISMTPHPWSNKENPYCWIIYKDGCSYNFGWSKTPEEAWKEANKYYKMIFESKEE